eukprot:scaffold3302_cov93-Skeletonema_marinoi.AAC.3
MSYRRPMSSTNPNEAISDLYDHPSLGGSSSSSRQQHYHSAQQQQQQQQLHSSTTSTSQSSTPPPPPPLASKPHAFRGAVLSPDHARNLTPDKALQLASALSAQASAAAQTKGVLPPGETVNLFQGCDMVELLAGISIGGSNNNNNAATTTNNNSNNSNSVFRNAPPSPKSPGGNQQHA